MHSLTRAQAQDLAVRAQLLTEPRPEDALEVFKGLTFIQMDLTAAVAPNADLVLWSRLGDRYRPEDLDDLLELRAVVEVSGQLRPAQDLALYRAEQAAWPGLDVVPDWLADRADWLAANHACHEDILTILRSEGPLPARDIPDTCAVPWRSSGWTNNKNVVRMLDLLEARGEVAVSSRDNGERVWDLADRVYPDTPEVPLAEARVERARRRLVAMGIVRAKTPAAFAEPHEVAATGVTVTVEGTRGTWQADPTLLDQVVHGDPAPSRTALLSPLDRLVYDRTRMAALFEFDYVLEMYKPAATRRWGYFALPVLIGHELVGKLDATTDPARGILRVDAMHWDIEPTAADREGVRAEIDSLAAMIGVEPVIAQGARL